MLPGAGNTKGGKYHFTVDWLGISCMTTDNFCFYFKTDQSKPVKQEVNGKVILPPLESPPWGNVKMYQFFW